MTYREFKAQVQQAAYSVESLRCDIPPTPAVLDFIEEVGAPYEFYVRRYQREQAKAQGRTLPANRLPTAEDVARCAAEVSEQLR